MVFKFKMGSSKINLQILKNLNPKLKLLSINILTFLILIIGLETLAVLGRLIIRKPFVGFLFRTNLTGVYKNLKDPCNRKIGHPILKHAQDINYPCIPEGGETVGQYVLYNKGKNNNKTILMLGGSTTDGFTTFISNGITWSRVVDDLLYENSKKYAVLNGGLGGYGSYQELTKLLYDYPRISREKDIKLVISLNGLNDIPSYRFPNIIYLNPDVRRKLSYRFPLLTDRHIKTIVDKKYYDLRLPFKFEILPSIKSGWVALSKNKTQEKKFSKKMEKELFPFELPYAKDNDPNPYIVAADQWLYNVRLMHALGQEYKFKYLVFLQPTMGLIPNQIPLNKESNDYKIFEDKGGAEFHKPINLLYKELKIKCKKLDYCIDISDIAPPSGDNYNDVRHHNENGNRIIGKYIYKYIEDLLE